MKKLLVAVFLFCFVILDSAVIAKTNINLTKSSDKKTSSKPKKTDPEAEKAKLEAERRADLDNSEWSVTIIKKGEDYAKNGQKDKLVFSQGRLIFENFFKEKGASSASFSLVLEPGLEGGSWETYVAAKDDKRLSIRGDWRGTVMNGTIYEQSTDPKENETYYFSSQTKVAIAASDAKGQDDKASGVSGTQAPAATRPLVSMEKPGSSDSKEKRY